MSNLGPVLLGTALAKSPGVQLAVDLTALVAVVILLAVLDVTSTAVWILLPAALVVSAAVRVTIVHRRARATRGR